jgi:sugar phosphate isomerase/epimerase
VHLGIKIGPDNWQDKLDNDIHVRHVEVYFDLDCVDAYASMFDWLRRHDIEASLHFSTALPGERMPNLATADDEVRKASLSRMRATLDVAASAGARYVIVHPGSYAVWGIREGKSFVEPKRTPPAEGDRRMREGLLALDAYGRARGVRLLAENMPAREYGAYDPMDRQHTLDVGFPSHAHLGPLGEAGVGLCVDVGHLYAEAILHTGGPDCFAEVVSAARSLAPYTRCVHLSTVVPPWNGTDSHNGFLAQDYAQGAVPSRQDTLAWLRLFDPEVWVIPEPWGGADVHLANHRTLRAWLERDA